jgi:hypothetical protein
MAWGSRGAEELRSVAQTPSRAVMEVRRELDAQVKLRHGNVLRCVGVRSYVDGRAISTRCIAARGWVREGDRDARAEARGRGAEVPRQAVHAW